MLGSIFLELRRGCSAAKWRRVLTMGKKRTRRSSFPLRATPGGHISSQGQQMAAGSLQQAWMYRLQASFLPHPPPAKVICSLFCFNGISQLTRETEDLPLTKCNLSALRLQELTLSSLVYIDLGAQPLQALTIPRK